MNRDANWRRSTFGDPLALVAATTERVHDEGPLTPRGVDEDGVVVVVLGLHRAQRARWGP